MSAGFDSFYGHVTPDCKCSVTVKVHNKSFIWCFDVKSLTISNLGYGWLTKELSNMCDGKMVVAFEGKQFYHEDNPIMSYIAESTAMVIKSLIYRNETPFMKRQSGQCPGLSERISLVAKTQSKFYNVDVVGSRKAIRFRAPFSLYCRF